MYFTTFTLFAVLASSPASAASTADGDLLTMNFTTAWKSTERSPHKRVVQLCATRSFHEVHENIHDLPFVLEDVWVLSASTNKANRRRTKVGDTDDNSSSSSSSSSMDFQAIVRTTTGDDETIHCSSGPLCDSSLVDQHFQDIVDNLDDRRHRHEPGQPIPTVNPPKEKEGSTTSFHDDGDDLLVRWVATQNSIMDWEESFCTCLGEKDPEARIKECSLDISKVL